MERTRNVNKPPKTTKTTAMLLASTQATLKLLSEADENHPNLPKPAAAAVVRTDKPPPAYQRHSDLVTAYLEEKEEKKYGMNRVRTEALEEKQPGSKKMNDNFVRLNMRNSAGSCRGARKKGRNSRYQDRYGKKNGDYKKGKNNDQGASRGGHFYTSKRTGLDPLDDYADGVFHKKTDSANPQTQQQTQQIPKCARHQLPCKLIVVKKTSTGNKGRKFYACSMPRGEQWYVIFIVLRDQTQASFANNE
jgi:hypothetical protein